MNLPDLPTELQWFKDRLRPDDSRMGNGIADWTITAEYVPNLTIDGRQCYGAMCSPEDHNSCLTPEDIEAKRAHVLMFVPESIDDMKEFKITLFHELRHVLYSMIAPYAEKDRAAEENATHSIDNFMKQLTPEELTLFRRAMKTDPMARAYRAEDGTMPDVTEDKDKKEPDKPAAQEGAPRDIAAIQADMAKADPNDSATLSKLAVELREALIAKGIEAQSGGVAAPPAPPPEMGMEPEKAYARQAEAKAQREAANAFVDALDGVPDDKKAFLREQGTIAGVKKALAFLPKNGATLGFEGHPALREKGDGDDEASVFYPSGNKDTMAACRVMARKKDGVSARGIHKCTPQEQRETGQLIRFSLTEAYPMLREVAESNAQRDRKRTLASIGGDK